MQSLARSYVAQIFFSFLALSFLSFPFLLLLLPVVFVFAGLQNKVSRRFLKGVIRA